MALPIVTATPERNGGHHIPIDHYETTLSAGGVPPIFDEAAYLRPVCGACTSASSRSASSRPVRVTSARIIRDLALDRYVVLSRCHGRVSIAILDQAIPADGDIRSLVVLFR